MATPQGQQLLVDNMIRGFEILKAAGKAGTTFGILKAGLVLKNETWADYSRRIQLPAFTDLAAWLTDGFPERPCELAPRGDGAGGPCVHDAAPSCGRCCCSGDHSEQHPPPERRAACGAGEPRARHVLHHCRRIQVAVPQHP
eukprot:Sspe_Gene.25730::Locus_10411_Transcript_1_1_Confidence_1.000_Length_790::g.25730::m.25730